MYVGTGAIVPALGPGVIVPVAQQNVAQPDANLQMMQMMRIQAEAMNKLTTYVMSRRPSEDDILPDFADLRNTNRSPPGTPNTGLDNLMLRTSKSLLSQEPPEGSQVEQGSLVTVGDAKPGVLPDRPSGPDDFNPAEEGNVLLAGLDDRKEERKKRKLAMKRPAAAPAAAPVLKRPSAHESGPSSDGLVRLESTRNQFIARKNGGGKGSTKSFKFGPGIMPQAKAQKLAAEWLIE